MNLIPNECDYLEDEYLTKSKQINRISTDSNFSDFYSDSDDVDVDDIDTENAVHFRQHFDGDFSRESNQSRFYGADVFDENEYDQCPIEFESCLQSLFSSRRNTVPFASPVTFLDENGELLNLPDSESSLKSSAPIMRSKINSVIDQHERPSCTPFVNATDYNLEENRRSLLQDSSEYHRGNSIRLRTMPMPIRANIITTKAFLHNNISGTDSTERFVQNIQIGTPMGTITRNPETNPVVINPINIKDREIIDISSLSQISEDKEINKHKIKRTMPDLRPALPARPFCWPFTLFPPDMTFCPRSLHAYHRRASLEAGQIPYYEGNIINASDNNLPLDMEPSFKESIKFGSVAKKIARMPSILSKVI
uniref:Uncharacterized protein n=1 Tax=Panagrolaimus sp. ES5 TaxID=591445 RepID=A0AC34F1J8_9BILA